MNFLKRAITSQLSHSSRKCLFPLPPLTQSSFYATTRNLDNPQTLNPRTQKPQEPSPSSIGPQRVKKLTEELTVSSRPSEIPYQVKVANSLNLIGHITTPIKSHSTSDGKYLSVAIISQENFNQSFEIPVVFEGDLALVVASHVKKNDCVYVTGRLTEDPLPFVLCENQGNFHVVVENINFVEGFEKRAFEYKSNKNACLKNSGKILESVNCEPKIDRDSLWRDLVNNPKHWRDFREQKFKGLVKERHPDFKRKDDGTALWLNEAPEFVLSGLQRLDSGVHSPMQKKGNVTKEEDSWKSLVENPSKWWDNRLDKKHAKGPDFRHKETGDVLWLDRLPDWVFSTLPPLKEQQNVASGRKNVQAT
ncbi:hypothetical protein ACH5RR_004764 [Cinchona calisaya]|uniref:Uncharacterized protein n=1 Tax=Cinchona calisaya TaxID=153742 RepID=A0ABD3AYK5_9GENT